MKEFGRYISFLRSLFVLREPLKVYYHLTLEETVLVGINSIFLVVLVSSFMGAVTTVQTAYNLTNPLIPKFVVSQVVRETTISELAPTVMAIIYAGKVGSSMAGGLGTMRITEQIDALEVMGINPTSYLVLPKVIASLMMYPLLVAVASVCAILGGYLVSYLTEVVSTTDYIQGIQFDFNEYMVVFAFAKSFVFAFMVSTISCFKGFYVKGGALEVGISSTAAVTASVVAILICDYLLALMFL